MKMLFDFFPVVLFFISYKLWDIYMATAVLIGASLLQTGLWWLKYRRFEKMHLVTLVLVCIFGGATLLLQNEMFIKWKPTVINWLFAAAFAGSHFIGQKVLIKRMMADHIHLPEAVWLKLNLAWTGFFLLMGALNLIVVYQFDTDTWVNFKMFGMLGLTFVFVVIQSIAISRYISDEPPGQDEQS